MRRFWQRRPQQEQPRVLYWPQPAPTPSMEKVVRDIIDDFDDYLRAPNEEGFFGEYADISRTSPQDLADRGVTIHFNRVLPTISIIRLAAKLTDEFLARGLRPRAYLDGSAQELHIPGVF